jgi:hypothetical protein
VIGWFFLGLVDKLTAGWTRRRGPGVAFFIVLGFAVAGLTGIDSLAWWAASGALPGVAVSSELRVAAAVPVEAPRRAGIACADRNNGAGLTGKYGQPQRPQRTRRPAR